MNGFNSARKVAYLDQTKGIGFSSGLNDQIETSSPTVRFLERLKRNLEVV
jgi:hypothetical protein